MANAIKNFHTFFLILPLHVSRIVNICDFDFVFNNILIQNTTFRNLEVKLLQWAENRQKVSVFRRLVFINPTKQKPVWNRI